jgi:hypothetical protein
LSLFTSQSTDRTRFISAIIVIASTLLSIGAIYWSYTHNAIIAYGDAESHLNIAKRVVDSLTPGFAQLGGIWLPLPHLLMLPFVWNDVLWRTGLAGSIVSGVLFVVACYYIYRTIHLITSSHTAGLLGWLIFATNPNILYMQSTPMTEIPLLAFFVASSYYFIRYLYARDDFRFLVLAGLFTFLATITRYDGWSLALAQATLILALYLRDRAKWTQMQGQVFLFAPLAFFGIGLWLLWDYLILGNALYFTSSQFSAKSQQNSWLARGELPAYHNLPQSLLYFLDTAALNAGVIVSAVAVVGLILYLLRRSEKNRLLVAGLLLVPIVFNIATLFLGQSVIFIPNITPSDFEWNLFNVRYGVMAIPFVAVFAAFLAARIPKLGPLLVGMALILQGASFVTGREQVLSYADGVTGLSHAKDADVQRWLKQNYTGGLVLVDDYARTASVIRSGLPMNQTIYVGNKPYWEESLKTPEKHAAWIVMQKDDEVWKNLYSTPEQEARIYAYYAKAYTSEEAVVFKRQSR